MSVYIAEAHAQDKWPISSPRYNGNRGPVRVEEARSNEDRCRLAAAFARNYSYSVPMVVDPVMLEDGAPGEGFEKRFAPWPIRFYVVENSRMAYIAQPDDCEYSVAQLRDWLVSRFPSA